jgi:hypothetical protein
MYKIAPKDKDFERPRITYMERTERGIMKEEKLHKKGKKKEIHVCVTLCTATFRSLI